jgi:hypothetical protein
LQYARTLDERIGRLEGDHGLPRGIRLQQLRFQQDGEGAALDGCRGAATGQELLQKKVIGVHFDGRRKRCYSNA